MPERRVKQLHHARACVCPSKERPVGQDDCCRHRQEMTIAEWVKSVLIAANLNPVVFEGHISEGSDVGRRLNGRRQPAAA